MGEITISGQKVQEITIDNQIVGIVTVHGDIVHRGWSKPHLYHYGDLEVYWVPGSSRSTGTVSKNSDHLYLSANNSSDTAHRVFETSRSVNLSGYSTLNVDWWGVRTGSDHRQYYFGLALAGTGYNSYTVHLRRTGGFARRVDSINVSGLSGNLVAKLTVRDNDEKNSMTAEMRMYRMWLS